MKIILLIDLILLAALALLCGYVPIFGWISLFRRPKDPPPCAMDKKYAVLVCARNEEAVIGRLLDSVRAQTYPRELLTTFVMADNCTDDTAKIARERGAAVYTRSDSARIGKGYALDALVSNVERDFPGRFDGFFIADADSVLKEDYAERMNEAFSRGHEIVSGHHNSLNMGSSLSAMGQGVMFMAQDRFFNRPRTALGLGTFIPGSGFLVASSVLREEGGWPYHMLTEDIQFTVDQLLKGRHAFHCRRAVIFDERPVKLRDSLIQLIRWIKGFLQVIAAFFSPMAKRIVRQRDFSCYDILMSYMPAAVCMLVMWAVSLAGGLALCLSGERPGRAFLPLLLSASVSSLTALFVGTVTVISEWKRIGMSAARRLLAIPAYAAYMHLLLGTALITPFCARQWKAVPRDGEKRR